VINLKNKIVLEPQDMKILNDIYQKGDKQITRFAFDVFALQRLWLAGYIQFRFDFIHITEAGVAKIMFDGESTLVLHGNTEKKYWSLKRAEVYVKDCE
jgi:hypothetical protein